MSQDLLESLLTPLSAESPCGEDPEYDVAFLALQHAAARKAERQFGDKVIPAQEPDWAAVHQQARALAASTRDLRVAVLLARSGARVDGLGGATLGLQVVRGLLERHWREVHPRLDASGDPIARLNALAALAHAEAGLADFRTASLDGRRGGVKIRDIELAIGHAEPLPGESVPTEPGVVEGVRAAIAAQPAVARSMHDAHEAALAVTACFERQLDATRTPDLEPLQKLLRRVADTANRVTGAAIPAPQAAEPEPEAAPAAVVHRADVAGPLRSREDVIRSLERACEWIELNEPANPAPLLIRRSQRLMTKKFVDIIRELLPDGVAQIEKLAGIDVK